MLFHNFKNEISDKINCIILDDVRNADTFMMYDDYIRSLISAIYDNIFTDYTGVVRFRFLRYRYNQLYDIKIFEGDDRYFERYVDISEISRDSSASTIFLSFSRDPFLPLSYFAYDTMIINRGYFIGPVLMDEARFGLSLVINDDVITSISNDNKYFDILEKIRLIIPIRSTSTIYNHLNKRFEMLNSYYIGKRKLNQKKGVKI